MNAVMTLYRELHDGLSDMVESGRLKEEDIPDDYHWLIGKLVALAAMDPSFDSRQSRLERTGE